MRSNRPGDDQSDADRHSANPVNRIVEAIAAVEGVDPLDLDFHLQEAIDTDAISQLVAMDGSEWTLQFSVANHRILLDSDDTLSVDGQYIE